MPYIREREAIWMLLLWKSLLWYIGANNESPDIMFFPTRHEWCMVIFYYLLLRCSNGKNMSYPFVRSYIHNTFACLILLYILYSNNTIHEDFTNQHPNLKHNMLFYVMYPTLIWINHAYYERETIWMLLLWKSLLW